MAAVDDRNWGAQPWRFGRAGITRLEAEQDRWFLWLPVAFGVGIAIYIQAGIEPSLLAVTALAIGAIVLRLAGGAGIAGFLVTTTLLAIALGVFAARVRTEVVRAPVLERQIGPVEVRGWVELVEPRPGRGQRITIWPVAMERMAPADLPVKVRVRTRDAVAGLKPGDSVRLRAMLGPPAGPSFPGDFDFARLAFFQQLGGIGIATGRVVKIDPDGEMPLWLVWRSGVETWRQGIGARITAALPGETGAIANALITGERGAISETTNQAYRDSGLFHILSISGLHMVIMAGAVFFVVRLVLAAIPALALRHPIKKWAAASAIAGAFAYLVISGSAFATVRSAIMITIIFGAVILDRPALALRNVALAALIILVLYPESLFDAGFQMSFAAVTALVSAYEALRRWREGRDGGAGRDGPIARFLGFVGEILLTTVIAGLAVAPFGIYHFHNTQLLAFIANIIAIPVCNLVVMPAALATLLAMPLGLETWPLWVMGLGIDAMTGAAQIVARLPGSVVRVATIPTIAFAAMIAGGLWLLLWSTSWRLLGLLPILAGLMLSPALPRPDILVSRDARTVAVRMADGTLSAIGDRAGTFDLSRWLEADADARKAGDASSGQGFACDPFGCVAMVRERRLSLARSPAALRDDCAVADVVIASFSLARGCPVGGGRAPAVVIDAEATRERGAHALYVLAGGGVRIETAGELSANRPWSSIRGQRRPRVPEGLAGLAALGRWLVDAPKEVDRDDRATDNE